MIGSIPIGGLNPIRIQSMTTTDTMDTIGTVEQSIRMVNAGCEYIRITAPSIKEARNLAVIKKELLKRGYNVPLIADIHFTPNAAEEAARLVEKVRINPGNYADKKKFENFEYTNLEYQAELERIYQKFTPLVKVCKEYGTAMRIGTNHGSLSDRIMSHYGDTPKGMVESAMEFMRMCEDLNYYNLVISMKSSNPQVMVQAYRLLVETMVKEGMNYPLHLGVTEAGDGEDGRIKSAVGIGALLEDGLGDTIRVSLTEDPELEAPVAMALADRYKNRDKGLPVTSYPLPGKGLPVTGHQPAWPLGRLPVESDKQIGDQAFSTSSQATDNRQQTSDSPPSQATDNGQQVTTDQYIYSPYQFNKRVTKELNTFIGGHQVPRVIIDLSNKNLKDPAILSDVGYVYSPILDKYNIGEQSTDFVYLGDHLPSFSFPGNLKQLYNYNTWKELDNKSNCHPLYSLREYLDAGEKDVSLNLVSLSNSDLGTALFDQIPLDNTLVFVLETDSICGMQDQRQAFFSFLKMGIEVPVIIKRSFQLPEYGLPVTSYQPAWPVGRLPGVSDEQIGEQASGTSSQATDNGQRAADLFQLYSATDIGGLMLDGFGDGVWLDAPAISPKTILTTSFGILQATRSRISKTEYISCPSCGRTLFDLQITTQMIRSRTDHLKGLKIGIMGCIVNGPGEMADADYGYVGTGPGKITLYRGKEVVKKNVNTENALDELIGIIREDGNWVEPEVLDSV